ncbi:MAG: T9SS type A sorting domain-containing protein, partial [Saprospiraceae bacterium]|nr:T9SS type A sorting domain-containing protein [Saprospiraceae bacterium]
VFSKASNASAGGSARPNLLVGNFPASGPGSTDYYDIYGNLFYQNPVEALFQGTGNIGFHNNILFNNMGGWGISIQSHNGFQPREIDLFFNTVLVDGSSGISVTGVNGSYSQRVWANAVFAGSPISGGSVDQNVTADFNQASNYLNGTSLPLSSLDLSPDGTALDISGIELSTFSKYTSPDFDFEGRQRSGVIAGAYAANSLIWPLQLMIRNQVELQDISTEAEIYLDQSSINIYPCPTDQFLQIEGLLSDYQISILDVNGTVFQTLNTSSSLLSVDLAGLPAGIFFISIFSNSHSNLSMVKMIKMGSF